MSDQERCPRCGNVDKLDHDYFDVHGEPGRCFHPWHDSAPSSVAEQPQVMQVGQWNGTVQPNGTVYDDKTLIQIMQGELSKSHAEFEVLRKKAYDAGVDCSLDQTEVMALAEIKRDAYPVYLAEQPSREQAVEGLVRHLGQALRQWKSYAEEFEGVDLEDDVTVEAEMYRNAQSAYEAASRGERQ